MPHIKGRSGIDWHYDIEGDGEELLFIHGWGVDKRIWKQQTKHFAQYCRVIAIDLPGHGKSGYQKVGFDVMGDDVGKILKHIAEGKVNLVGSSLGGLLGLQIYDKFPELFRRLIFVGSMPKFSSSEDYPYGINVHRMQKLGSHLSTDYPSIVDLFFRSLFTKQERESRRYKWLQKFRQMDEKPMKQALVDYLDILDQTDLRDVLPKINIPTQFINGEGDGICTQETVGYLKKTCPNARFDDFEECGHFPFLSKPHEFNQTLSEFLEETR